MVEVVTFVLLMLLKIAYMMCELLICCISYSLRFFKVLKLSTI